jgi:hypothetical protein
MCCSYFLGYSFVPSGDWVFLDPAQCLGTGANWLCLFPQASSCYGSPNFEQRRSAAVETQSYNSYNFSRVVEGDPTHDIFFAKGKLLIGKPKIWHQWMKQFKVSGMYIYGQVREETENIPVLFLTLLSSSNQSIAQQAIKFFTKNPSKPLQEMIDKAILKVWLLCNLCKNYLNVVVNSLILFLFSILSFPSFSHRRYLSRRRSLKTRSSECTIVHMRGRARDRSSPSLSG